MADPIDVTQGWNVVSTSAVVTDSSQFEWDPSSTYVGPFVLRGVVESGEVVRVTSLETSQGTWIDLRPGYSLPVLADHEVEAVFNQSAVRWANDTMFTSSVTDLVLHPDYQRVIGLGFQALPLIMARMVETSEHWMWALKSITGEDPGLTAERVSEAIAAWRDWYQQSIGERRLPELPSLSPHDEPAQS